MENKILRLLFKFETEYRGNPLYITGNAFRHAFSLQINTSIGIFTDIKQLYCPKTYEDFFGPRIKRIFLLPYIHTFFCKYTKKKKNVFFFRPKGVIFDIINAPESLLDYITKREIIQLGGGRNKTYGVVSLIDNILIELSDFNLPDKASHLTLISPLLEIPKFAVSYNCRQTFEVFWNNGMQNKLKIIPPGQFFRIKEGKNIRKTALNGILRKNLFGKFGYGEFIVHDWKNGGN